MQKSEGEGGGISGGPVLSALSCVPKFAAMAQALIENIWATAVAAYRWGGGQGTRGLVRERASGEKALQEGGFT